MLKVHFSLLVCFLFLGCWELDIGPRPGLWYKHKTTGEEIKIGGMGIGKEVYEEYKQITDITNAAKHPFIGYDEVQIMYNPGNDNRVCVAYERPGDFEKRRPTYLCIIPARDVWMNYQRIARRD